MPVVDSNRTKAASKSYTYLGSDVTKTVTYTLAALYVKLVVIIIIVEPFLKLDCEYDPKTEQQVTFHNPQYVYNPCRSVREWKLLGLTVDECDWGRRLVTAVVFGSFIGWERRNADRPAGIRTMALVSLGACLFSICSAFAFLSGPMNWDASRISAAIPSGVGFLGSALIFKHTTDASEEKAFHEVHGLTTAASVWLSAAVGVACAGELYFVASLTTAIVLVMLRFGPRTSSSYDDDDDDDEEEEDGDSTSERVDTISGMSIKAPPYVASYNTITDSDPEMQRIIPGASTHSRRGLSSKSLSKRSLRPSLM